MRCIFKNRNNRDPSLEKVLEEIKILRKNLTGVDPSDILRYSIIQETRSVVKEEINRERNSIILITTLVIGLLSFFIGDKYDEFKQFLQQRKDDAKTLFENEVRAKLDEASRTIEREVNVAEGRIKDEVSNSIKKIPDSKTLRDLTDKYDQMRADLGQKEIDLKEAQREIENIKILTGDLKENASEIDSVFKTEDRLIQLLENIANKINQSVNGTFMDNIPNAIELVANSIQEAVKERKSFLLNAKQSGFYVYIGTSKLEDSTQRIKNPKFTLTNNQQTLSSASQLKSGIILEAKSGVRTRADIASVNNENGEIQLGKEIGVPLSVGEKVSILEIPQPIKLSNGELYHIAKVRRVNN